jgi:uncharacterized membrane protein
VPVRFQALLSLLLISAVMMILALISGGSILQVLVIPLVVVLPGFALTPVIFPQRYLTVAEQLLLNLGLSLTLVVLSGLILDWTPWGLQTLPWAIFLGSITVVAGGISLLRHGWKPLIPLRELDLRINLRALTLFTLAGLIVIAALLVARNAALQTNAPGFTQLWLLPGDKAGQDQLRLGLNNQEGAVVTYKLQVKLGSLVVQEWPALSLKPLEQWETLVTLPPNLHSGDKIEALLYKAGAPDTVYRQVTYALP